MKNPWFLLSLSIAAGTFFADRLPEVVVLGIGVIAFFGFLLFSKKKYALCILLAVAVFSFARFTTAEMTSAGGREEVSGVVSYSAPYYYDLKTGPLRQFRILSHKEPKVGERIAVRGEVVSEGLPQNPGGFNSVHYLKAHFIQRTLRALDEEAVASDDTLARLYSLRRRWQSYGEKTFQTYFSKENAEILSAMLFASDIDWDDFQALNALNLIHIISISGLHIGLILALLKWALKRSTLDINIATPLMYGLILVYLFLTAFPVGGMRVWLSLLFTDIGKRQNSPVDSKYALSFSTFIFLVVNPFFIYHLGFLFSFLSVFGILWLHPSISSYCPRRSKVFNGLSISIAVSVMIIPLLSRVSDNFSAMGIIANVFLIPVASVLLYGGIALSISHLICSPLASGIALMMGAIFDVFNGAVTFFSTSGFQIPIPAFTVSSALFYYTVWLLAIRFPFRQLKSCVGYLLIAYSVSIFIFTGVYDTRDDADMHITQLYVGQGDCALVETGDLTALIDTGGSAFGSDPTDFYIVPYLRYRGIRTLDAIFISHYDIDHCGGIFTLADHFSIRQIFGPEPGDSDERDMYANISNRVSKIQTISGTYPLKKGQLKIYPSLGEKGNSASQAMVLSSKGANALFLGDMPEKEEIILSKDVEEAAVLKLAHHGSKTSSSEVLLAAVKPKLALISAGAHNLYGHPHKEVIDRLKAHDISYLETKNGAIHLKFKDGAVNVSVYRGEMMDTKTCIILILDVLSLIAVAFYLAKYLRKREVLWNQLIIEAPILFVDRKNTVWNRSACNSKSDI